MYDLIGDLHGHFTELISLLKLMGYSKRGGVWCHPERTLILVGDLIDRGGQQRELIDTVRAMIDAGSAQMCLGNHELNAIGYATLNPSSPDTYLRPHTAHNRKHHIRFLEAYPDERERRSVIEWFKTLPLWLDLDDLKVIHACWHEEHQAVVRPHLTSSLALGEELFTGFYERDTAEFLSIEVLLKGIERELPDNMSYVDSQGTERTSTRMKWWAAHDRWVDAVVDSEGNITSQLDPSYALDPPIYHYDGDAPVFFGHYWMRGVPHILTPKAICLDWSVAKEGRLAAYRWYPDEEINDRRWVSTESV